MCITSVIFGVYYKHKDKLQRRHDPNRISNIKTAMELEDADFVKMVDELKIEYDENDLREVERDVQSRLTRQGQNNIPL